MSRLLTATTICLSLAASSAAFAQTGAGGTPATATGVVGAGSGPNVVQGSNGGMVTAPSATVGNTDTSDSAATGTGAMGSSSGAQGSKAGNGAGAQSGSSGAGGTSTQP